MATAPSNRRTGTGFINLADWSRANEGAANSLAGKLAGDVQRQGQDAQRGVGTLSRAFGEGADDATLRYEDPEGLERADYLSREGYNGPRSLSDVGDFDAVLNRADAAERAASRVGDYYGRQAQLQGLYGQTGAYTPGQQRLDSALAGVAGASRFADLQSQWGNLYGQAQQADREARAYAGERDAISTASAQRYGQDAERYRTQQRQAEAERIERETADDLAAEERQRRERRQPGGRYGRRGDEWGSMLP